MECLDYFPKGLLVLPPNNVPLTDEFNIFPKVEDDVVVGAIPAAWVANEPENNIGIRNTIRQLSTSFFEKNSFLKSLVLKKDFPT